MTTAEFLNHFRAAAHFLTPWEYEGGQPPTPEYLTHAQKYAALWLTPRTVEDFDTSGFYDLSAEQKEALRSDVDQFRALAEQVATAGAATPVQAAAGLQLFRAMYRVLGPFRFDRQDIRVARLLGEMRRAGEFPPFVVGYEFELGDDHTGDPAVWVWLIVTDESEDQQQVYEWFRPLRAKIADRLDADGIDRLVYLYYRTVSEQTEALAGWHEE